MNKRKATQLSVEFLVDLLSLLLSNAISYIICIFIHKVPNNTKQAIWIYLISLILSFCVIFFGFSVSMDLSVRNRAREFVAVLRNCLLTYMTLAVALVLTRSDFINGRYMFLLSLELFIILSCINRYFTKRLLVRHFYNSGLVSLTGVITVGKRAQDYVAELQQDWTRNIKGIALLDAEMLDGKYVYSDSNGERCSSKVAVKSAVEKRISDVPVVANITNVVDWVRRESLDEVYINIPYEYEAEVTAVSYTHLTLPTT